MFSKILTIFRRKISTTILPYENQAFEFFVIFSYKTFHENIFLELQINTCSLFFL